MKKIITIICDVDVPTSHLLNSKDFEIYEAKGENEIVTMVSRSKEKK